MGPLCSWGRVLRRETCLPGACCQYPSLPHPTSQRRPDELMLKQPQQGAQGKQGWPHRGGDLGWGGRLLRANRGLQGVSSGKQGCGGEGLGVKKNYSEHLLKRVRWICSHHNRCRDQRSGVTLGSSVGGMRKLIRCGGLWGVEGEGFLLKLDVTRGHRWAQEKVPEPDQAENLCQGHSRGRHCIKPQRLTWSSWEQGGGGGRGAGPGQQGRGWAVSPG